MIKVHSFFIKRSVSCCLELCRLPENGEQAVETRGAFMEKVTTIEEKYEFYEDVFDNMPSMFWMIKEI